MASAYVLIEPSTAAFRQTTDSSSSPILHTFFFLATSHWTKSFATESTLVEAEVGTLWTASAHDGNGKRTPCVPKTPAPWLRAPECCDNKPTDATQHFASTAHTGQHHAPTSSRQLAGLMPVRPACALGPPTMTGTHLLRIFDSFRHCVLSLCLRLCLRLCLFIRLFLHLSASPGRDILFMMWVLP